MLPFEVVARRRARGSWLQRYPGTPDRHLFSDIQVEFFLKTANRTYEGKALPCDDPFFQRSADGAMRLYHPHHPMETQSPFLTLPLPEGVRWVDIQTMAEFTETAFELLEIAFDREGYDLDDIKFEFGRDLKTAMLRLADAISADEWRAKSKTDGSEKSKQIYREGAGVGEVAAVYRQMAEASKRMAARRQEILKYHKAFAGR